MCCLFGLLDYGHALSGRQKSRVLSVLATQCEVRGTDATGIAYNSGGKLRIYKRPLPAHKLRFFIPDDAAAVMGHTRMTTQGSETRNYNNHPFLGRAGSQSFALAHNGVLHNDLTLQRELRLPKTRIQTDSYIAVQLLEHKKSLDLDSLKFMAEQVEGSFTFTILDERDNLYFIKGDNPLCIYHYPKAGLLLYASTEEILASALKKLRLPLDGPEKLNLSCGEMRKLDAGGRITRGTFDTEHLLRAWYSNYHVSSYRRPLEMSEHVVEDSSYIYDLKSVAGAFGYSPENVDSLLREGFSPEELEEYFYCGEL